MCCFANEVVSILSRSHHLCIFPSHILETMGAVLIARDLALSALSLILLFRGQESYLRRHRLEGCSPGWLVICHIKHNLFRRDRHAAACLRQGLGTTDSHGFQRNSTQFEGAEERDNGAGVIPVSKTNDRRIRSHIFQFILDVRVHDQQKKQSPPRAAKI